MEPLNANASTSALPRSAPPVRSAPSITDLVRALRHRNFQMFFFGQGVSLMGTWAQRMAQQWLVLRLTNSTRALGIVAFCSLIPTPFLAPWAGVLADRKNKHKLLIITQFVSMLQALGLAWLALDHPKTPAHYLLWTSPLVLEIMALSTMLGVINAFDVPIRQSFLVEMVDRREDLSNAIALNSMIFNTARLVGPAFAGTLLYLCNRWYPGYGEGICFVFNGLSFIAVLAALYQIRVQPRPRPAVMPHPFHALKEGFRYAFNNLPIRAILLQLSLAGLLGMGVTTLLPAFATHVLHGQSGTFGLLLSFYAAGSLVGIVYLLSRRSPRGLALQIACGGIILGLMTVGFGVSHTRPIALLFVALAGLGSMMQMISCNTLIQTICEDDKRGRVMSLYTVAVMGMSAIGAWLAGEMGFWYHEPKTLVILGVGCLLAGVYLLFRLPALNPFIQRIFVQRGIISDQ